MTEESQERRRFTRVGFESDAAISQGDNKYDVQLIDISLNGVLIETPADYSLKTDQPIEMTVGLADDIVISMRTSLAHSSQQMLGLKCESIDMESMTHLRKLIELNMEDPEASERVLDELLSYNEDA